MTPHGGYPQPRKPMSMWEHKAQIDWIHQDTEAGDEILHEMLCVVYTTPASQNN